VVEMCWGKTYSMCTGGQSCGFQSLWCSVAGMGTLWPGVAGGLSSNLKERDELDWTQPVALEGPESFWARVCGVFPGP
jgi:hypothetical protein